MKKFLLPLLMVLYMAVAVYAQTPNQFKYQAVLRDATGAILENESVAIGIAILQGSNTESIVFNENHSVTTFSYNDLSDLPELFDGDYESLTNTPITITEEQSQKIVIKK